MLSSYKNSKGKQCKNYHLTYTLTDFYNDYRKNCNKKFTKKEFVMYMTDFFSELKKEIIENRYHFKMPYHLGLIRIKKGKSTANRKRVDWLNTKKHNKKIYHNNMHTDGFYFKWVWDKKFSGKRAKNIVMYHFRPLRISARYLASHIKKCASDPFIKDYDVL